MFQPTLWICGPDKEGADQQIVKGPHEGWVLRRSVFFSSLLGRVNVLHKLGRWENIGGLGSGALARPDSDL